MTIKNDNNTLAWDILHMQNNRIIKYRISVFILAVLCVVLLAVSIIK